MEFFGAKLTGPKFVCRKAYPTTASSKLLRACFLQFYEVWSYQIPKSICHLHLQPRISKTWIPEKIDHWPFFLEKFMSGWTKVDNKSELFSLKVSKCISHRWFAASDFKLTRSTNWGLCGQIFHSIPDGRDFVEIEMKLITPAVSTSAVAAHKNSLLDSFFHLGGKHFAN